MSLAARKSITDRQTGDITLVYSLRQLIFTLHFYGRPARAIRGALARDHSPESGVRPHVGVATHGEMCVSFFSLPRHDVVFPLIFRYLDTVEVWNLRAVSKDFLALCEDYFQTFCRVILYDDLPRLDGKSSIIPVHPIEVTERRRMYIVSALKKCRKMEHFSLKLRPPADIPKHIYLRVVKSCNHLMLSLSHTNCQLVSLTLQNVECSHDLSSCFEKLGRQCWRLRELHVEALTGFDDGCLSGLAGNCRLIARLTLKTLPKLHGTCLEKLAEMCSLLEHLNVCVAV